MPPPGPPSFPHGGGGGGPPSGGLGIGIPARLTIKFILKPENLPKWNREERMAISYFWKCQHLAMFRGQIPTILGQYLWHRLDSDSDVYTWFSTLLAEVQAFMRVHYANYLRIIRTDWLGDEWQLKTQAVFKVQRFRQRGYEKESPQGFVIRRIMYVRMLNSTPSVNLGLPGIRDRGPKEVKMIVRRILVY